MRQSLETAVRNRDAAAEYVRTRMVFDRLDIGDDDYPEALAKFESARDRWEAIVDGIGVEDLTDALAIVWLELSPHLDQLRRLQRETRVPMRGGTSALAPADMLDTVIALRRVLADVQWRYEHDYPSAYEPARHGASAGGGKPRNADGSPHSGANETGATTAPLRRHVEQASRLVLTAYSAVIRAQKVIGRLEEAMDAQIPERPDWASDRQRERTVGRLQLIALTRRKLEDLERDQAREEAAEKAHAERERQRAERARKVRATFNSGW